MRWTHVFRLMVPNLYVESIYEIDFDELKRRGVKSIIVDLDNTLVESTRADATPRLVKWLDRVQEMGFHVMIVSNNHKTRVSYFATPLHIPFIHRAKKPFTSSFRQAMQKLGTNHTQTAMIGDQLLTDILGGNRMGLYTILVVPLSNIEGFFTRINRKLERFVFRWMEKRGMLRKEEDR
jgi:uncharacterized protein